MLKTQQPTLPESIAQHYIPNRRQAVKILSDDERIARKERIKQENKERKKKWREQNAERSTLHYTHLPLASHFLTLLTPLFLDKDNDLRCRVHKRANAMFGFHSSEQKKQFIEDEFRKRQLKRRGRDPHAPLDDSSQGDDAYTAFLNNPEFAKVFSDLITEKGLGNFTNDVPMLLEYLKTTLSPENLRSYFHMDGQPEEAAEVPYDSIPTALPEAQIEQAAAFDVGQTAVLELQSPIRPDSAVHPEIMPDAPTMIQLIPTTAPSPRLNVAVEMPTSPVHAIPQPAPPPLIPIPTLEAIPIAPIPLVSNQVQTSPPPLIPIPTLEGIPIAPIPLVSNQGQSSPPPPLIPIPALEVIPIAPNSLVSNQGQSSPPPPQDRVRAFGFPPMMKSR